MTDAPVAPTQKALTPVEQEEVDALYFTLKPEAILAARSHVMSRTPAAYQEAMTAKIDADFPPPPPPAPPATLAAPAPAPAGAYPSGQVPAA